MRTTCTWPVSVSTSTSAKLAPWAPLEERPKTHSPRAEIPADGSAAQACFQSSVLPLAATVRSAKTIWDGVAPSTGARALAMAALALTAADLTAGDSDGAV